jgi:acyl dehydratase
MLEFICERDKVFTEDAMEDFRAYSGDNNRLHCDLMYAKLNNFPHKVVYGCLILTELISTIGPLKISAFRADFINPIFVNEIVKVRFLRQSKFDLQVEIINGSQLKMKMKLELLEEQQNNDFLKSETEVFRLGEQEKNEIKFFLGTLSESVGMVEPGDLALIRSINFRRKSTLEISNTGAHLERLSDRFGVFHTILTTNALVLEAFSLKRNFKSAAQILDGIKQSFGDAEKSQPPKKILVYGITGTMGLNLGLMCAFLGHEVLGVYRSSEARATELYDLAQVWNLNIKLFRESELQMPINESCTEMATVVLYCSSPRIQPNFGRFSQSMYESYKSIYVDGLAEVIKTFPNIKNYFVPSTVILNADSPFKYGQLEYSLAKAEQEDLMNSGSTGLNVLMPRVDLFPGRHSQMSFSAGKDVLIEVQVGLKHWLGALN